MGNYIFVFLTILGFLAKVLGSTHMLLIWEHKDFKGEEGYALLENHKCYPFNPNWQNRISSVDTARQCYQLFTGRRCDGRSAFVYPSSKHHNDLSFISMNDQAKSVKLCTLDEVAHDRTSTPLKKNSAEFLFWDFVFRKINFIEIYLKRTEKSAQISWDFLPGVDEREPLAEQYQDALDWLLTSIKERKIFHLEVLKDMRMLAYKVFDARANSNAARTPRPPVGSEADAIFFQLEIYWKYIVEAIDDEMERIESQKSNTPITSDSIVRKV